MQCNVILCALDDNKSCHLLTPVITHSDDTQSTESEVIVRRLVAVPSSETGVYAFQAANASAQSSTPSSCLDGNYSFNLRN